MWHLCLKNTIKQDWFTNSTYNVVCQSFNIQCKVIEFFLVLLLLNKLLCIYCENTSRNIFFLSVFRLPFLGFTRGLPQQFSIFHIFLFWYILMPTSCPFDVSLIQAFHLFVISSSFSCNKKWWHYYHFSTVEVGGKEKVTLHLSFFMY